MQQVPEAEIALWIFSVHGSVEKDVVGATSAASARDTERTDDHWDPRGWKRSP